MSKKIKLGIILSFLIMIVGIAASIENHSIIDIISTLLWAGIFLGLLALNARTQPYAYS